MPARNGSAGVQSAGATATRSVDTMRPQSTARTSPLSTELPASTVCAVCGQGFRRHARCRACSVLLGAGHGATAGPLCGGCEAQQRRSAEGAKMVAAAVRRGKQGG